MVAVFDLCHTIDTGDFWCLGMLDVAEKAETRKRTEKGDGRATGMKRNIATSHYLLEICSHFEDFSM